MRFEEKDSNSDSDSDDDDNNNNSKNNVNNNKYSGNICIMVLFSIFIMAKVY